MFKDYHKDDNPVGYISPQEAASYRSVRHRLVKIVITLLLMGVFAMLMLLAWTSYFSTAAAHQTAGLLGWHYDVSCCSNRDCGKIPDTAVEPTPQGWKVTLKVGDHPMVKEPMQFVVPYNSSIIKESKDEHFHACLYMYKTGSGLPRCFYRPNMGL